MAALDNYRSVVRGIAWMCHKRIALVGALSGLVEVAARLSMPWIIGLIIDDALVQADSSALLRWSLVLVAVAATSSLLKGLFEVSFSYVGARSLGSLQQRLFEHLHASRSENLRGDTSGRLNALFTNDARKVGTIYTKVLPASAYALFQLVILTAILIYRYGPLASLAVLIVPIYIVMPIILGKPTRRASRQLQECQAEVSSWLQEAIGGLQEIKTLGCSDWSLGRLKRRTTSVARTRLRLSLIHCGYNLNRVIYWAALGVIYWLGGQEVLAGRLTIGELVALVAYLGYLEAPVGRFFALHSQIESLAGPLERVMGFLQRATEDVGSQTVRLIRPPAIELQRVDFAYPGASRSALTHLDLVVEPGQRVAIVGPSGAGKSTLLKLLLRLNEPDTGSILLDGIDLKRFGLASLRAAVSVVFQQPNLFSMSIAENIRLGRRDANDTAVRAAATAAFADDFIRDLPEGYDTQVGEHGDRLSVGQKQRIAIARALLRDTPLVLLDEATSALDAQSEEKVRLALKRLMRDRTCFIVAHRLATVRDVDRIFVLEEGRLTATGAHDQLLDDSPTYRQFYRLQASA